MSLGVGDTDLSGPTSTTKAMLINIVCPRRIGHESTTEPDDPSAVDKVGNKTADGVQSQIDNKVTKIVFDAENDLGELVDEKKNQEKSKLDERKPMDTTQESKSRSSESSLKHVEGTPKTGNSRKTLKVDEESPLIGQKEDAASSALPTVKEEDATTNENKKADTELNSKLEQEASDHNENQIKSDGNEEECVSETTTTEEVTTETSALEEKVAAEVQQQSHPNAICDLGDACCLVVRRVLLWPAARRDD